MNASDLCALLAGWEQLQLARGLPAPPRTAPGGARSARPILLDGAPATERELHVSGRPATALFETPEARSLQEATRLRPPSTPMPPSAERSPRRSVSPRRATPRSARDAVPSIRPTHAAPPASARRAAGARATSPRWGLRPPGTAPTGGRAPAPAPAADPAAWPPHVPPSLASALTAPLDAAGAAPSLAEFRRRARGLAADLNPPAADDAPAAADDAPPVRPPSAMPLPSVLGTAEAAEAAAAAVRAAPLGSFLLAGGDAGRRSRRLRSRRKGRRLWMVRWCG